MNIQELISKIQTGIINPLIGLLFSLATLIFFWGVINYVIGTRGDEKRLALGKTVMAWGIIGMFVMASAWGIVNLFCEFFGTCEGIERPALQRRPTPEPFRISPVD